MQDEQQQSPSDQTRIDIFACGNGHQQGEGRQPADNGIQAAGNSARYAPASKDEDSCEDKPRRHRRRKSFRMITARQKSPRAVGENQFAPKLKVVEPREVQRSRPGIFQAVRHRILIRRYARQETRKDVDDNERARQKTEHRRRSVFIGGGIHGAPVISNPHPGGDDKFETSDQTGRKAGPAASRWH